MLDYLSTELTSSVTQVRARDMVEQLSEEQQLELEQTKQREQDHIFGEVVKVCNDLGS